MLQHCNKFISVKLTPFPTVLFNYSEFLALVSLINATSDNQNRILRPHSFSRSMERAELFWRHNDGFAKLRHRDV